MTTGKTIALTRRTIVGKAMSLLFNMLSRLVIAFLPKPWMSCHTPGSPLTPPDVPVVVWASGSIPGSGRSHGGGNGNPLQHSCLENPVARRAWWGTVHEVTNSQTRLSRHSELSTLSELWSEMILPAQCHILLFSFPFFCSFIFLLLLLYPSFPCRQIGQ